MMMMIGPNWYRCHRSVYKTKTAMIVTGYPHILQIKYPFSNLKWFCLKKIKFENLEQQFIFDTKQRIFVVILHREIIIKPNEI